ncbi:hypothetical protein MHYP_G00361200, partial [Metynnis hypsauchen]
MRLMRYSYSISHVSGKCLWTADTLSRAPVKRGEVPADKELFEDTNIYVDMVMENLPASTAYLEELRDQLQRDSVCARVMQLCAEGWPAHGINEPALKLYWTERALLTVQDGLLLKGQRLVIPSTMRNDVLNKLHEGHQGEVKCRERARQSGYSTTERVQSSSASYGKKASYHCAYPSCSNLNRLTPGQDVWVTDQRAAGAVIGGHSTPRSYLVEGPHGSSAEEQVKPGDGAKILLYVAQDIMPLSNPELQDQIRNLVDGADVGVHDKQKLQQLLINWPSVCTTRLGHTTAVTHRIATVDELPLSFPVDWAEIAKAQSEDASLDSMWTDAKSHKPQEDRICFVIKHGILFRSVPNKQQGQTLQMVVPVANRRAILQYAHDSSLGGHLGRMKTLLRLLDLAYWPTIRTDVWQYCKECETCQMYKPRISKLSGFMQSTPVVEPGYMLGIDLMGPLLKSPRQNEHLLVIVDYCSKWVELFPLRTAKAPQIANILVKDIFTRWGTPAYLVSDRGPQFTSHLLHSVCRQWGVVQKLTTAYHPQTNLTERVNRNLKTMMASFVQGKHRLWDQWLADFRFAINSAWHESTGFTPAEIAIGRKLKGPLERFMNQSPHPDHDAYKVIQRQQELIQQVQKNVQKHQTKQAKYYNRRRTPVYFQCGDK